MTLLCFFLLMLRRPFLGEAQKTFRNPVLADVGSDPSVIKHNGSYYMVYAAEGYNRIEILKSPILSNWRSAERQTIYKAPSGRANLWTPEIHFIQGDFYVYFSMGVKNHHDQNRMFVIKAVDNANPMGEWSPEIRLLSEEERYATHGYVFQHRDCHLYFIWSGEATSAGSTANLFIAKMINPTRVISPATVLRTPTKTWEVHRNPINEAPSILQIRDRTFLIFSASDSYSPNYCLGIMGIDGEKDPLVISNWWDDVNECVFQSNDNASVYGPGHASFVSSPDDSELWMAYDASGFISYDGTVQPTSRTLRIQKLDWQMNAPKFPLATGLNTNIPVPQGE